MRLDHIQLAMPSGEESKARAFFSGLLGMREQAKPPPLRDRGGCWFCLDATIVHVGVEENFRPQTKAHPAFLVSDLDGLAAKMEAAGHTPSWDDSLSDRRRFYTTDPFGNRIEFMADGDGFSQR